jgi:ABC-type Mn2+/Zn2+ transport system permease subunit
MSSTLRDATENTVHSLTELVGDAVHHLELPRVDLGRLTGRRSSRAPLAFALLGAAILVVVFVAMRRRQTGATADAAVED